MSCSLSPERIEATIEFHGHSCPGLTIGIRAAEYALNTFGPANGDLVAVAETDMCGVDAIQFLTGCTFGKGNFIHRDYGKMAFAFHDRSTGRGVRLLLNPTARGGLDEEMGTLMTAIQNGTATEAQRQRNVQLRAEMQNRFMSLPLEEMFIVQDMPDQAPRGARIMQSIKCDACGEMTMESRTRRFCGQTYCIPCFGKVEQKI